MKRINYDAVLVIENECFKLEAFHRTVSPLSKLAPEVEQVRQYAGVYVGHYHDVLKAHGCARHGRYDNELHTEFQALLDRFARSESTQTRAVGKKRAVR